MLFGELTIFRKNMDQSGPKVGSPNPTHSRSKWVQHHWPSILANPKKHPSRDHPLLVWSRFKIYGPNGWTHGSMDSHSKRQFAFQHEASIPNLDFAWRATTPKRESLSVLVHQPMQGGSPDFNNHENPRAKNPKFLKLLPKTFHGEWTY